MGPKRCDKSITGREGNRVLGGKHTGDMVPDTANATRSTPTFTLARPQPQGQPVNGANGRAAACGKHKTPGRTPKITDPQQGHLNGGGRDRLKEHSPIDTEVYDGNVNPSHGGQAPGGMELATGWKGKAVVVRRQPPLPPPPHGARSALGPPAHADRHHGARH